ncbi:MAG: hypothetical protein EB824_02490 [Thaumarchaeota archaeon S15]|nr:MAG: hypothetical protein EB833_02810 [Thaumarchaeota archaeon S13]RNJ74946.1 MAG: hypothetical protein EB824_02490 [Thaumarchaeota archaeon S15]
MGRDVYVSATLAGRHSLGPDAVAKACGEVERELRDGTAEYAIRSFMPGNGLTRCGGRGGSGLVTVKIDESSFMAVWDDVSSFDAPTAALGAVGRLLGAAGEISIRVTALVADVAMGSVQFAGGLSPATFATTTFHLSQPAPSGDKAGEDEAAFGCVATRARSETANISIIGERKSAVPAVRETLARALDALSAHCEVLTI